VAAPIFSGVGLSAGTSTATGVGRSTHAAVGSSTGLATVLGVGQAVTPVTTFASPHDPPDVFASLLAASKNSTVLDGSRYYTVLDGSATDED
jgi:hypothetical protein